MNELAETLAKQSELILGLSKELANVTKLASELAERVVRLEEDNVHILENMGIKG